MFTCREYTRISAQDITEYQYDNTDTTDGQTSISVEKYHIGRDDHGLGDLVSSLIFFTFRQY